MVGVGEIWIKSNELWYIDGGVANIVKWQWCCQTMIVMLLLHHTHSIPTSTTSHHHNKYSMEWNKINVEHLRWWRGGFCSIDGDVVVAPHHAPFQSTPRPSSSSSSIESTPSSSSSSASSLSLLSTSPLLSSSSTLLFLLLSSSSLSASYHLVEVVPANKFLFFFAFVVTFQVPVWWDGIPLHPLQYLLLLPTHQM